MNQNLYILSHPSIVWTGELPPAFPGVRLPGGTVASAIGEFGSVCIQQYQGDEYTISYTIFDLLQELRFKKTVPESGLYSTIVLEGSVIQPENNNVIRKNQFGIFKAPLYAVAAVPNPPKTHTIFETFFSIKMVREILHLFPSLIQFTGKKTPQLHSLKFNTPVNTDVETLDLVQKILHCPYKETLRSHYFDSRARDLLFKLLILLSGNTPLPSQPTEEEIDAMYKAERMIMADLSVHIPIPVLAAKVYISTTRFKTLFKMVFNKGAYEYLLEQRLITAKQLLEEGVSIKEVAMRSGYRLTNFITAFKAFHGFTPGSVIQKRRS